MIYQNHRLVYSKWVNCMVCELYLKKVVFVFVFFFYFILLYNTVWVLPYIDMNPPRVYMSKKIVLKSYTDSLFLLLEELTYKEECSRRDRSRCPGRGAGASSG